MQQLQLAIDYARDLHLALRRHWPKSLACFVAIMILATVAMFTLPRTYHSEAKLFVRFGRTMVMDPTATATSGQVMSLYDTRENELNSLLEVLGSRSLLDRVVETIGADNILRGRLPREAAPLVEPTAQPSRPLTAAAASKETHDPRHQQAVAKLEKSMSIQVPRKTCTIIISGKAETPEMAQRIVATLVSLYMDEHLRVHQTAGSYEFFLEQSNLLEKQWKKAAGQLQSAKTDWKIVTLEGKRKLLEGQISDLESKALANSVDLASAVAKIESLSNVIGSLPERIPTQSVDSPNQVADGMRQELYKVESREQELAAKFSERHPQVLALRNTIKDLRAIIDEQKEVRSSETTAVNPSRQTLELTLLNERSNADSLRGKETLLHRQREELNSELRQLNTREVQLAKMQRDVDQAESRFRAYNEKLEQSRINAQLDQERISNLSLVQPASFVAKPSGPRRLYALALGFVLAFLAAGGVAVVAAFLDPMLKNQEEIEQQLRIPCLGTISLEMA